MEIWIWISLWIVQTIVGAVFYRKYQNEVGQVGQYPESALIFSALVLVNMFAVVVLFCGLINVLFKRLFYFIDFLAGVKNKTENDNI